MENYDYEMMRNPLKRNVFDKRLKKLKQLGLPADVAEKIESDFNAETSDPTHSIYIMDWWNARLALGKFSDTEDMKYYDFLPRWYARYKIQDYHDIDFDGELDIEHWNALRHYAHMAAVNPVYQIEWPQIPPSELIAELKQLEANVNTNRVFRPKSHAAFLRFADGAEWVIAGDLDKKEEARSMSDCATPEESRSLLLALRMPERAPGYYKTLLHAELNLPRKQFGTWENAAITEDISGIDTSAPGVIVQLRGRANSKPKREMHRYIVPLLAQPYIGHVVEPQYSSLNTFVIKDLPEETIRELLQANPQVVDPTVFAENNRFAYDPAINKRIIERIDLPANRLKEIIGASRISPVIRNAALRKFFRAYSTMSRRERSDVDRIITEYLKTTKDRGHINSIFSYTRLNHKKKYMPVFVDVIRDRPEWFIDQFPGFLKDFVGGKAPMKETSEVMTLLLESADRGNEIASKAIMTVRYDINNKSDYRYFVNIMKSFLLSMRKFNLYVDIPTETHGGWGNSTTEEITSIPTRIPGTGQVMKLFYDALSDRNLSELDRHSRFRSNYIEIVLLLICSVSLNSQRRWGADNEEDPIIDYNKAIAYIPRILQRVGNIRLKMPREALDRVICLLQRL